VIVIAVPTVAELPLTLMEPVFETLPLETFPDTEIVAPASDPVKLPSVCAFSATVVLALLAASTSSETFARIV
jgi:hypothetical protein